MSACGAKQDQTQGQIGVLCGMVLIADLSTEAAAYRFLEELRWGSNGPTQCPHCGSGKGAWFLNPKDPAGRRSKGGSSARSDRRVWKCKESSCRRQFSVLTNSTLHGTKMPVRTWINAVLDLCSEPEGVSAREIAHRSGIAQKSAITMLERIERALVEPGAAGDDLSTNDPLWFEVTAPDPVSDLASIAPVVVNEESLATAKILAAEQVRSDVERALAEAFAEPTPEPKPAKPKPVRSGSTVSKQAAKPKPVQSGSTVSKQAPKPVRSGSTVSKQAAKPKPVKQKPARPKVKAKKRPPRSRVKPAKQAVPRESAESLGEGWLSARSDDGDQP